MNRAKQFGLEKRLREREALLQSGLTPDDAEAELDRRESHKAAVAFLHAELFSEEYDFIYDDGCDAAKRRRGENPMREEHLHLANAKREAINMPRLDANGCYHGDATRLYCERLVVKISEILSGHGASEIPAQPCPVDR